MRFIEFNHETWTLTRLAQEYHLAPGTLHNRIHRFGETATGIHRALATGIMTSHQAGLRGAARSPWRYLKESSD